MADSLIVRLALDAAEYTQGLKEAKSQADAFGVGIKSALDSIAERATEFLSVAYFKELISGAIEAQAHLDDLSKKTGVAALELGGLGLSARQVGSNLDSAAAGISKLNRSIADAAAGSQKALAPFTALGLDIKAINGSTNPAGEALDRLADSFAATADGPQKTALALRLFGKAGADMIPILDQGSAKLHENAEFFKEYSGVSEESARNASAFGAEVQKLKVLQEGLGNALANAVLPILSLVVGEFIHASEESDHFATAASALKTALQSVVLAGALVVDTFRAVGEGIATAAAKAELFQRQADKTKGSQNAFQKLLDPFGTGDIRPSNSDLAAGVGAINDAHHEQRDTELKRLQNLLNETFNPVDYSGLDHSHAPKGAAPPIPDPQAAAQAAAILKKQLDGQIALIKAFAAEQAQAYAFANQYVENEYDAHLLSLADKFAEEDALRKGANAQVVSSLDQEIAAERLYISKLDALRKSTGGAAAEGEASSDAGKGSAAQREAAVQKIKALEVERTIAVQKGAQESVLAHQKEGIALEALAKQYESFQAEIANLRDNDNGLAAAQIANAQKVKDATHLNTQRGGGDAGEAEVAQFSKLLELQTQLNVARKAASELTDAESNAEAQLAIDQTNAGASEFAQLSALRDLRVAYIATLQAQTDKAQDLAAANPDNAAAVKDARDLTLALKQAKAAADPLGKTINDLFKNDFADNFAQFLDGTKSLKDAFRSFADSVIADLARIAAKDLATQIFGTGSGAFGSGGGSGGGLLGSLAGLFSSGGSGGGSGGLSSSDLGSLFGAAGYGAYGGMDYVPYNGFNATLHEGERVLTKGENRQYSGGGAAANGPTYVVNMSYQAGQSRDSAQQQGAAIALGLSRANARGN